MMVLKAFGGSLGLLLEALGGLLAALWGLYIDHRGLPDSSGNFLGPRLLASGCFFSFIFVFLSSMSYFIFFRCLLASILSSQANPPTLKNLHFLQEILTFLRMCHRLALFSRPNQLKGPREPKWYEHPSNGYCTTDECSPHDKGYKVKMGLFSHP